MRVVLRPGEPVDMKEALSRLLFDGLVYAAGASRVHVRHSNAYFAGVILKCQTRPVYPHPQPCRSGMRRVV